MKVKAPPMHASKYDVINFVAKKSSTEINVMIDKSITLILNGKLSGMDLELEKDRAAIMAQVVLRRGP